MKQNVKIFLIALFIGMGVAFLVCYKFDNTIISKALNNQITYFYVGSYTNKKDANTKKNQYKNAVIYNNKGIYQVIIGIYSASSAKDLMSSFFLEKNIVFKEAELKVDHTLLKEMQNYELLIESSEREYYENINSSLLKLFEEYINKKNGYTKEYGET